MLELLVVAGLASALVGMSTLAARRWGHTVGGVLSAFPLIVGPVLLVAAERHGTEFAARAAGATLLGSASLCGFALVYARAALRWGWAPSLLAAWSAAALLGVMAGRIDASLAGAIVVAVLSIAVARAALPRGRPDVAASAALRGELPVRMAFTALLIVLLSLAADRFGPIAAGILSALPTLASVLAVSTHRRHGRDAVLGLLRGMVGGIVAFAAFCAIVGGLVDRAGPALAFVLATAAAVAVQLATVRRPGPVPRPAQAVLLVTGTRAGPPRREGQGA